MKRIIAILAALIISTVAQPAYSATTGTLDMRGLSAEQIAELQNQVAKMRSPENVSTVVRKEAQAWADLGANIGTAMVSAAKEIGVAANEFSQTSLGKIVTGIVVYKVMGRDILGVAVGSFVMLFCFSITLWALFSTRFAEVKYEYRPVFWGLYNRRVIAEYKINSDGLAARGFTMVVNAGIGLIVGLNCIF